MAYTINKTNTAVLTTIADGSTSNTTSLTLIGKNYPGYGEILNENFVRLLESHASASPGPTSPIAGQLWWDTTNNILKVHTGTGTTTGWRPLASLTSNASTPTTSLVTGDLWWKTDDQQLKAYNGSTWVTVGPAFSAGVGTSGAIVETVLSNLAVSNTVISLYTGSTRVAIVSKSDEFTPGTSISGFAKIYPGITLANVSVIPGVQLTGTASNADKLDSLDSTDFLRATANASTSGTLQISNNSGLYVGSTPDGRLWVSSSNVILENQTNSGQLILRVRDSGGTQSNALAFAGTGAATFSANVTAAGNVIVQSVLASTNSTTGSFVTAGGAGISGNLNIGGNANITGNLTIGGNISSAATNFTGNVTLGDASADTVTFNGLVNSNVIPSANATYNLGNTSNRWNNVWGVSSSALYADLAERYAADGDYKPGTVLTIGGDAEVTAASVHDDVFGVVSTSPAYLMNDAAGTNDTHPPVALIGRVPVRVLGQCRKGDKLAVGPRGVAVMWQADPNADDNHPAEVLTQDQLVGRALADKYTDEEELVETVLASH
jgi:hypothetical protein